MLFSAHVIAHPAAEGSMHIPFRRAALRPAPLHSPAAPLPLPVASMPLQTK